MPTTIWILSISLAKLSIVMGANQSSYNHGHDSARAGLDGSNAEANISYYELLGIDRTADEDEYVQ